MENTQKPRRAVQVRRAEAARRGHDERAEPSDLADDLLRGIKRIAEFIGETESRTNYLGRRKLIPIGKIGRSWIASKRRLRKHYADLSGAA
jgi:hypothetical protein